jgi:hypothetical protein
MEFRIWVETRLAGRVLERRLVAQVEREATGIGPEQVGLSLEEGKTATMFATVPSNRTMSAFGRRHVDFGRFCISRNRLNRRNT